MHTEQLIEQGYGGAVVIHQGLSQIRYRSSTPLAGCSIRLLPLTPRSDGTPDVPAFSYYSGKPPMGYTPAMGFFTKIPAWAGMYGMVADFPNMAAGQYLVLIVRNADTLHPIAAVMIQLGGTVPEGGLRPTLNW